MDELELGLEEESKEEVKLETEMKIVTYFAMLSGISSEEALRWEPLCRACAEELRSRLRKSVVEEEHSERLALAAAAMANYRFSLLENGGAGSVRVGEISYNYSEIGKIKEELLYMVKDLLDTEGMELKSVVIT